MSEVTADELLADAEQVDPVKLGRLVKAIPDLLDAERKLEEATVAFQAAQARHKELTTRTIPELMRDARTRSWTLEDGRVLSLKDVLSGSIPKDPGKQEKAYAWLRDNGHGGIIKHVLSVELGKGSDNVAKSLVSYVKETYGLDVGDETSVHYQTLQAFLKEIFGKRAKDPEVAVPPDDLFGVYRGQVAQLSMAKTGKK